MGRYINIGNDSFRKARNSEYVDKSPLIGYVNRSLNTEHNMLCLTRARRFGKSMAAKMLNAYYDQSVDSRHLFTDLKIAQDSTFEHHLNHYPVVYLDITTFTTRCSANMQDVLRVMTEALITDCKETYNHITFKDSDDLPNVLLTITEHTHQPFIMIIDEWDAICREAKAMPDVVKQYVDWLRGLFKTPITDRVFAGVYMTGILPIIQYDTQSALNNFEELTMISPGALGGYFGFTEDEVQVLCAKYDMDIDTVRMWYDGYQIGTIKGVYNPYSVMSAIRKHSIESYWTTTGAYESLLKYITLDFDGLKGSIVELLSDNDVPVNVLRFSNDIHCIQSRDDALTTLVHLGYLSYDNNTQTCRIPNYEVQQEFQRTIGDTNWKYLATTIQNSEQLLQATLAGNERAVEEAVDFVHQDNTSILQFNDENSLACVLSLAYIAAHKDYVFVRELPAGKGFADIVLIPRSNVSSPAIVLELKCNKSARAAITQIKRNRYCDSLKNYIGNVVLVGINYDKKTKVHTCQIEHISNTYGNTKSNTYGNTKSNTYGNTKSNTCLPQKQQDVLSYCKRTAHTAKEIFAHLGISTQAKHYAAYIDYLLQHNLLEDVTPERQRNKRYKTKR